MSRSVVLRIPATTANLGPGFDLFGLALDLYSTLRFTFDEGSAFHLTDMAGHPLPIAPEDNLIRTAYAHMFHKLGGQHAPKWDVAVDAATAPGKGFGSSAMAVVAGVHLAWALLQAGSLDALLHEAGAATGPEAHPDEIAGFLDLEPHPDNVVPARLGGWVFCSDARTVIRHTLPDSLGLCVLIPDYSVSTEKSRMALPTSLSREDGLSNMRGCLLWLEYIHTGNTDYLVQALDADRMHEPYRTPGLHGFAAMKHSIHREGCLGMTLSGSGPGMIIYFDRSRQSELAPRLRSLAMEHIGPGTSVHFCKPAAEGLVYLKGVPASPTTAPLRA